MAREELSLPGIVLSKASVDGDGGARWADSLPAHLDHLEQAWSVRVGEPLGGGTSSFTARAWTAEGTPVVLKVAVPDPDFPRQVHTLLAAEGRGYVRVLEHDLSRYAVLLESLGPSADRSGLTPERQLVALADTLRVAWQVPRLPQEAHDKAAALGGWVVHLWEQCGCPCPEAVVAEAVRCAERRAAVFDPEQCVIVHGDAAPPNLLQMPARRAGAETGFVFVDPDGFVGDPTYDLGVALRDWTPQLLAGDPVSTLRRYCRLLADRTGVDDAAIWQWGFLERVCTGLYALSLSAQDLGAPLLATTAALVLQLQLV